MNEVLFEIILGVIAILGIVITRIVYPYIKEKIGNEQLIKYEYWASVAVKCAEMIFVGQGMGATKKEYVVNFLDKLFNNKKTVITREQIEILIEAAVKEMKLDEK